MPIGKNAIKRVENNGYSKVESSAPDMENSTVIPKLDPQVEEKMVAPVEKKTRAKKTPAAPVVTEATPEATEATPAEKPKAPTKRKCAKKVSAKDGFVRVEVGEKMPYYLL